MLSNIYTHSYVILHCSVQSCGGHLDCAQHSISILTYEVCVHPRVSILAFLFIKSLSNLERIKRISEFYHIIPLVNSRVH